MQDIDMVIRDKYNGDASRTREIENDSKRLACGEPLAYVIGWTPFLGLKIFLEASGSRALIPRPETEWWTEKLIAHLSERFHSSPKVLFKVLDLCAGSGAIGLAVLSKLPNAQVSFGELDPALADLIHKNILTNNLDASRAEVRTGDLFEPFPDETFDIIVTNPPYIPSTRELSESVTSHEPHEALFSGVDGLDLIRSIIPKAPAHLSEGGELWLECDISNIETAKQLASLTFKDVTIHLDQYARPRLLIAH